MLLRKEGVNFRTTAEFEIVRTIKEKACYLSKNPQKEETVESEKVQYQLPDGSMLEVFNDNNLIRSAAKVKCFPGWPCQIPRA
jgi:hypothetical protein